MQISFSMQKLTIFRKIKSKIPDFEGGKSRDYAEAYKWQVAQVIPQIDPREISSAFHPSTIVLTCGAGRAGAEIAEKGHFRMETI